MIPLYQVDAFTRRQFAGNPAAVCPLPAFLPDATLQAIAAENNLAETAFLVREGEGYRIRWFTPLVEVDLCGHATLASAWVIFEKLGHVGDRIDFASRSGPLTVRRLDDRRLELDFPTRPAKPCAAPAALLDGLGVTPREVHCAVEYLVVLDDEAAVRAVRPDARTLGRLDRGVIVTARGTDVDFVSRFFTPAHGIDEDPVTGSAHCTLTPFWAERLGKTRMQARQVSARGGELEVALVGDRVTIAGHAVLYLEGQITVE